MNTNRCAERCKSYIAILLSILVFFSPSSLAFAETSSKSPIPANAQVLENPNCIISYPDQLELSPDEKTIYVFTGIGGAGNTICVIDTQAMQIRGIVTLPGPNAGDYWSHPVFSPDGTTLYSLYKADDRNEAIAAIDTTTLAISRTYPLSGGGHFKLSQDGKTLVVLEGWPEDFTIPELRTITTDDGTSTQPILLRGHNPVIQSLSPSGKNLYIQEVDKQGTAWLKSIDTSTGAFNDVAELHDRSYFISAETADHSTLFVPEKDNIVAIHTDSKKVTPLIQEQHSVTHLSASKDGNHLLINESIRDGSGNVIKSNTRIINTVTAATLANTDEYLTALSKKGDFAYGVSLPDDDEQAYIIKTMTLSTDSQPTVQSVTVPHHPHYPQQYQLGSYEISSDGKTIYQVFVSDHAVTHAGYADANEPGYLMAARMPASATTPPEVVVVDHSENRRADIFAIMTTITIIVLGCASVATYHHIRRTNFARR